MKLSLKNVALVLVVLHLVKGYPWFADEIPNGYNVPSPCEPGMLWLGVGHNSAFGGDARNVFGKAFAAHNYIWNQTLCEADSDKDGFTNGDELGDPDCTWTRGQVPNRTVSISHPGIPKGECEPM